MWNAAGDQVLRASCRPAEPLRLLAGYRPGESFFFASPERTLLAPVPSHAGDGGAGGAGGTEPAPAGVAGGAYRPDARPDARRSAGIQARPSRSGPAPAAVAGGAGAAGGAAAPDRDRRSPQSVAASSCSSAWSRRRRSCPAGGSVPARAGSSRARSRLRTPTIARLTASMRASGCGAAAAGHSSTTRSSQLAD